MWLANPDRPRSSRRQRAASVSHHIPVGAMSPCTNSSRTSLSCLTRLEAVKSYRLKPLASPHWSGLRAALSSTHVTYIDQTWPKRDTLRSNALNFTPPPPRKKGKNIAWLHYLNCIHIIYPYYTVECVSVENKGISTSQVLLIYHQIAYQTGFIVIHHWKENTCDILWW